VLAGELGARGRLSEEFCGGACRCNEACMLSLSCGYVCGDRSEWGWSPMGD